MQDIGVGLLGFGTVGAGVVDALARNGELLASRAGVRPVLRRIADLDLDTDRGVAVDRSILTRDAQAVVDDPAIPVIVELIGGTGAARALILRALERGKSVVTANKALLAEHGREIFDATRAGGADLYFEASVGGGIPIIRALRQGLVANRIRRVCGIVNGTCNYILTRMEEEGLPFDTVLAEAQRNGFAEADPGLDIDGRDTAHKAVILAGLAAGTAVPIESVRVEGIRGVAAIDIAFAAELGYRLKLLAVIDHDEGTVGVRVNPALVPHGHPIASVGGVFNAILVSGDIVGDTLYYGRGAGRYPTASAVLGDVAEAARRLAAGDRGGPLGFEGGAAAAADPGAATARYYLRLSLRDRPGILAKVAHVLGAHEISIASVLQKEAAAGAFVPVLVLTHHAQVSRVEAARRVIDELTCVGAPTVAYRIEDFAAPAAGGKGEQRA
jgi:homoserine dehydrogenase